MIIEKITSYKIHRQKEVCHDIELEHDTCHVPVTKKLSHLVVFLEKYSNLPIIN